MFRLRHMTHSKSMVRMPLTTSKISQLESQVLVRVLSKQMAKKVSGPTVAGGAAGGHASHQMGGGKLATAGDALLGAVGMNMATHQLYVKTLKLSNHHENEG
ncbi:uncharacterized protein N7477_009167 [Penicillium maclennaniae]|uniref:uncharacterized protein n=1 Tax=Penicillium maclennaniae TaxID=1343394 RepID=UPI0025412604|nr:uncharacterized protein N7477_009167 [Penicillium maclennaniae]KAJ5661551.1 hypothetical protein N7477_009167 [Penicillium maclennaniae]